MGTQFVKLLSDLLDNLLAKLSEAWLGSLVWHPVGRIVGSLLRDTCGMFVGNFSGYIIGILVGGLARYVIGGTVVVWSEAQYE